MATIANNHLSLKSRGRGGDTELAHVNPREKSMLKAMGGSGGINPNTGLREYQVEAAAAIIGGLGVATGAVGAFTSGQAVQTQAKYAGQAATQGLADLRGVGERLDVAAESRRKAASQDYSLGLEQLSSQTGFNRRFAKTNSTIYTKKWTGNFWHNRRKAFWCVEKDSKWFWYR